MNQVFQLPAPGSICAFMVVGISNKSAWRKNKFFFIITVFLYKHTQAGPGPTHKVNRQRVWIHTLRFFVYEKLVIAYQLQVTNPGARDIKVHSKFFKCCLCVFWMPESWKRSHGLCTF